MAAAATDELTKALPLLGPKEDTWHVIVHKLRVWAPVMNGEKPKSAAEEENLKFVRPFLILIVSLHDQTFLSTASDSKMEENSANVLCLDDWPTADQVSAFVKRVMHKPQALNASQKAAKKRTAGRPKRVMFAHTPSSNMLMGQPAAWPTADVCPYVEGCRESLKAVGIDEISFAPVPDFLMQNVIRSSIEEPMTPPEAWGTAQLPGLDDVEGFSDKFGASLFSAAAAFLTSRAVEAAPGKTPLRVTYRVQLKPGVTARVNAFVLILGTRKGAGGAEGAAAAASGANQADPDPVAVSIYKSLEQAAAAAAAEDSGDEDRPRSGQSCVFVDLNEMPFADMDMIEASPLTYEVADEPEALPLFSKVSYEVDPATGRPVVALSRPSIFELQSFEVALRALAALAEDGSLARIAAAAREEAAEGGGAEQGGGAAGARATATTEVVTQAAVEAETVGVEVEVCETAAVAAAAAGVKDLYL